MEFFGLCRSIAALATSLTLATVVNCGMGFQRGTQIRWQLCANVATEAPTLTEVGSKLSFATLFLTPWRNLKKGTTAFIVAHGR